MATGKDDLKQAQAVFDTVCEYLDSRDLKYQKEEDELKVILATKGDDLLIPLKIAVDPAMQIISVFSGIPFVVPEEKRIAMTLAVTAANYCIADGSFDYAVKDGEIVFRITSSYRNSIIGKDLVDYLLMCAAITADRYNDKFQKLAEEDMTVGEIVAMIYEEPEEE